MIGLELWSVLITFICCILYSQINKRKWNLLYKIPGLKPLPILGNVGFLLKRPKATHPITFFFQHQVGKSLIFDKEKMHLMWIGREPILFLIAPETVEAVMSSSTAIEKGSIYRFVEPWLGNGLLLSTGEKWRKHRKLLTPSFHFRILEKFEPIMNEKALILVTKVKEISAQRDWIDAFDLYSKCTLDIIFETSMGTSIEAQERDSIFGKMIHDAGYTITYRSARPWLRPNFLFYSTKEGKRFQDAIKYLHSVTNEVIAKRIADKTNKSTSSEVSDPEQEFGLKKRLAFLDLLMESELSPQEMREQVDTFMFAGHDTTATALSWMTYLLGLSPTVQEKLLEEIDSIFGDDKARHVNLDDLKELKYMECVIKESQRVYPSVPGISRNLDKDTVIGGYEVPKGTECFLSIYSVHRNPTHYPQPEVFDPERFSPENSTGRHPYAFVPFSAGPRNCIGQKFALMEQKIIMCHILRNFKLLSLDQRDKITLVPELVLRTADGIRIKFLARE